MLPPSSPDQETIVHRGIKIPIFPELISPKIIEALRLGRYEYNEASRLEKLIEKDEVVLELGGGIGFMSSVAALNRNTKSVEVFEANPNLKPLIETVHAINQIENTRVNTGVLLHDPVSATVPFYIHEDFWASSLSPGAGDREKVDVPTFDLNATLERIRPTLIICDIEGGEMDLFEHADLKGVRKILIEIHQNVVGRANIKRLFDIFSSWDFHYDEHHSAGSVILFSHIDRPGQDWLSFQSIGGAAMLQADETSGGDPAVAPSPGLPAPTLLASALTRLQGIFEPKETAKKFHLHLGAHQTATTRIQEALKANSGTLLENGIVYWDLVFTRENISPFLNGLSRKGGGISVEECDQRIESLLGQPEVANSRRVLISDENLLGYMQEIFRVGGYNKLSERFEPIQELLKQDVKVFITIRHPADFFAALYCGWISTKPYMPFEKIRENQALMEFSWLPVCNELARIFGRRNVVVFEYQTVTGHFKETIAEMLGSGLELELPGKTHGASLSAKAVEAIRLEHDWKTRRTLQQVVRIANTRFPIAPENPPFDPWAAEDRARLDERYQSDLRKIGCWQPPA